MTCILALDQGTTSSRAIVFDRAGRIRAVAQKEFEQIFPRPGWVEHDPNEIWSSQAGVAAEAVTRARVTPADIAAIGITNQRETAIVWNRRTGEPDPQRDRLAGPPHRRALRPAQAGRASSR
jgi:glycerol kinase